ncbi:hypothetical protein BT63DRAFT_96550 [Microthyrium microscopicum]|uniref:Endonuclease/exonuclease/phosphatase domain-containing protein n=1 Tax=Microthyrium microscopicum TaxID=703497 RepID=A0A6A6TZV5_9PEZI|nr:hypothetical protein BT63DRAFT_96550 [Microthyrium microscopicum]
MSSIRLTPFTKDYIEALSRLPTCPAPKTNIVHAQWDLYSQHRRRLVNLFARDKWPEISVKHPQVLRPYVFDPKVDKWEHIAKTHGKPLHRGKVVRVYSYNRFAHSWGVERMSALLDYLKTKVGPDPNASVIMLQEVQDSTYNVLMNHPWVKEHYVLSNISKPESVYTDIPDESFTVKLEEWTSSTHATSMLVSKDLSILNCVRIPFENTFSGREALPQC